MSQLKLRLATQADTTAILGIYAPFILNTAVTFENVVPSLQDFWLRIQNVSKTGPWIIAEGAGEIAGYAYAGKHRDREAYQWSVEPSVYVAPDFHKQGVATALYEALFKILKLQGFYNAYAGITLPNSASVALHESMGFEHLGTYRSIGYKQGAWLDVGWWSLLLQEKYLLNPPKPKSVEELDQTLIHKILSISG